MPQLVTNEIPRFFEGLRVKYYGMKNFHKRLEQSTHGVHKNCMESGKIRRCQDQDFGTNASAPTIETLHKSTVKSGSLVSLPSCPEECEAVFQRFLPLSILPPYKQKGVVRLSAYDKTIRTRALASPN